MRVIGKVCGAGLLFAFGLLAATVAAGENVTWTSASPYQLADLLDQASPTYDLQISGELIYPPKTKDRMPAVVFLHGSSGPLLRHQRYFEAARALGFVTLQIDSFRPRGITSTVGNQANVTAAMMTIDLLRALHFLAARPDIDADKIVVMGSSKGAIAALYATWNPIRKKLVGDLDYAGYILLYPLCTAIEDGNVSQNPVHVFIGKEDNWTPAAPCIEQVARMKSLGRKWSITLYDGAYHGFDAPVEGIRSMPYAYSMSACKFALRADGYEYEAGSGFLLTKAERRSAFRSCAKKGDVKMGGYHAADALLRDVGSFLESFSD